MGRLEEIERGNFRTTFDVENEVFLGMFQHFVRTIVWLLQGCPDSIMSCETCAGREVIADVDLPLHLISSWCSLDLLHGGLQVGNVNGRSSSGVFLGMIEEFTG